MVSGSGNWPGGLLGSTVYIDRHQEIFANGFDKRCVQNASYDLRVANTKMILPNGRRVPEGVTNDRPFVVMPGGVAMVSTLERLHLPVEIAGNISIKFTSASQGILVLMGMIVDPGYGSDIPEGRRLHFLLANVGRDPLTVYPGIDRVAALQLIHVGQLRDATDVATPRPSAPSLMDELFTQPELPLGLSLFETTASLETRIAKATAKVDEHVRGMNQVVFFGHFLLGTAILGAVFTTILAWSGEDALSGKLKDLGDALPSSIWPAICFIIVVIAIFGALPYFVLKIIEARRRSN